MSGTLEQQHAVPPTVGALLRLAWLDCRERMYSAFRQAGYTDLQPAHVLLFRYPTIDGLRPGTLAGQSGVSKQAMNDLLRSLEAKGYIELRPDPSDGRARLVALTERGSRATEFFRAAAADIAAEWTRIVGPTRYDALRSTLLELVEATRDREQRGDG